MMPILLILIFSTFNQILENMIRLLIISIMNIKKIEKENKYENKLKFYKDPASVNYDAFVTREYIPKYCCEEIDII